MPKLRVVQSNFTAGEISPYLHGRADFNRYQLGAYTIENFVVIPHGGLVRRSGTRFVNTKKTTVLNNDTFRLIPFVFSEGDAFVLEFGDGYVRFFKNGAPILSGGSPYEVVSPYSADTLATLDFAQSGNIMYLFHPEVQTQRLIRVSDTDWVFTDVEFYDGPYNSIGMYSDLSAIEEWTMAPSATGSVGSIITINIKDSGGTGITPLDANDVGRFLRIYHVSGSPEVVTWGVAKITSLNATAPQVNAEVVIPFGATTDSAVWRISIFRGPDNWPAHGSFFEERLVWAKTKDYPNSFGGSVTDDFSNFSPSQTDGTVADDNAYFYTLGTGQIDDIQWVSSGKSLLLGTSAGPYSVTGSDIRTPVSPTAIQATKETSYGSSARRPVYLNRSHLYLSQTRRQLHEMYYSLDIDGFMTPVVSIMSEHILRGQGAEIWPAEDPYHCVWGYCDDGSLFSLTYMKDQNVVAMVRHPVNGLVRAMTSIPTSDYDQVWMVVERTIDGNTVYCVEYIEDLFIRDDDGGVAKEDGFFVDSGYTYNGVATNTVTVAHLPNTEVEVLADGNVHPPVTTNGAGQLTLDYSASKIHVGLKFTSKLKTLPIDIVSDNFVTQAANKQVRKMFIDVLDTLGGMVGDQELVYRDADDVMDSSVPLFTGLIEVPYPGATDRQIQLEITHDLPLPMHIRAIVSEMSLGE